MDSTAAWLDRLDCERRLGNIPGNQARVLAELWRLLARGDAEPSEARLADLAGVSRSTVTRAKRTGRALGLLDWERRREYVGNLRRDRPCLYWVQTPPGSAVRRVRQTDGRQASKRLAMGPVRSVQQQLAGLPPLTEGHKAMLEARRVRLFGVTFPATGARPAGVLPPVCPVTPLLPLRP